MHNVAVVILAVLVIGGGLSVLRNPIRSISNTLAALAQFAGAGAAIFLWQWWPPIAGVLVSWVFQATSVRRMTRGAYNDQVNRIRFEKGLPSRDVDAPADSEETTGQTVPITRQLSRAIDAADVGQITYDQLLIVFQEAIDNGDVLAPGNELSVVSAVLPLIDAGRLNNSGHMDEFENRMSAHITDYLAKRRGANRRRK